MLDTLGGRFDLIYSLAQQPVAYPGNSSHLGVELNANLYYQNVDDGFYAGLQYGVLFPLGALDRPESIYGDNQADASVAQTLQGRIMINF